MKKWCKHIVWDSDNNDHNRYYWQFNDGTNDTIPVYRNWKVCPICQAERPTKKNIKKERELEWRLRDGA